MADTLNNIPLPADTWVDLYAASGITVGLPMVSQNLGGTTIRLTAKATSPLITDGYNELAPGNDVFSNENADSGAWAFSPVIDSLINVKEA